MQMLAKSISCKIDKFFSFKEISLLHLFCFIVFAYAPFAFKLQLSRDMKWHYEVSISSGQDGNSFYSFC